MGRIVASLLAIGVYETAVLLAMPWLRIETSPKFDRGDTGFYALSIRLGFDWHASPMPAVLLGIFLLAIWWRPIARRIARTRDATPGTGRPLKARR